MAQKILVEDARDNQEYSIPANKKTPEVGRAAAQKYFSKNQRSETQQSFWPSNRLLSLHWGGFINSKSYSWGHQAIQERVADQSVGVTYKMAEWVQSMDLSMRIDYMQYAMRERNPIKLSILPLFTFPESSAHFPLYFGAGMGVGAFISQLDQESVMALDYQLVFGIRMQDIWGHSGFFIESGLKDHLHLLSDGQFSGQFLGAGAVFSL